MRSSLIKLAAALAVSGAATFSSSQAFAAPIVTPGLTLASGGTAGADRLRFVGSTTAAGAGAGRNYLGRDDLGNAANRTETNAFNWASNPISTTSNFFSFEYDTANDRLVSAITPFGGSTTTLIYANFLSAVAGLPTTPIDRNTATWNAMQISVTFRSGPVFSLSNVLFNGSTLGTGSFPGVFNTTQNWLVTNYDFRNGFLLTGNLDLRGPFSTSQEINAVNVRFGHDPNSPPPPSTVPEPSTIALIGMALLSLFGFGMMRRRAEA